MVQVIQLIDRLLILTWVHMDLLTVRFIGQTSQLWQSPTGWMTTWLEFACRFTCALRWHVIQLFLPVRFQLLILAFCFIDSNAIQKTGVYIYKQYPSFRYVAPLCSEPTGWNLSIIVIFLEISLHLSLLTVDWPFQASFLRFKADRWWTTGERAHMVPILFHLWTVVSI